MKRRSGYMLLEVVLAMSIFVIAVVGLLRCLSAAQDADYQQRRLTNTRLNLRSLLDESMASPPKEESRVYAADAFHVRYQRIVKPERVRLGGGKELQDIFKVTVVAQDTTKDNRAIGELWTYVSP